MNFATFPRNSKIFWFGNDGNWGDEFFSVGNKTSSDWMDQVMDQGFETKKKHVLGPGAGTQGSYLHRTILYWPGWGFGYQPDTKHTLKAAEQFSL